MIIRNARRSKKRRSSRKSARRVHRRRRVRHGGARGKRIRPVIIKVGHRYKRPKRSRTFRRSVRINPRHRRRYRRIRHNPKFSMKGLINKQNLMTLTSISVGLIAWPYVKGMLNKAIPEQAAKYERFTGVVPVLIGMVMLMTARRPFLKNIGLGIGAFGVYDLLASNVAALKLSPPVANLGASYPVSLGAAYRAPQQALGTPAYGRPPAVSQHYMSVSGDESNPYDGLQW